MKIIEEQLLLNNINKIQSFLNANKTMRSIFGKIGKLENKSLQEVSLKSDIEFFDEISFILSVITSIITHPQITTKGEDIIIRADQAHTIQNESYQKLIQDDKLWKQDKLKMIPEYVYYHQNTDEIVTYENRFIVLVLNIIEQELKKYSDFYISLIPSYIGQDKLSIAKDSNETALRKINLLQKKIKFIKNTYFYKIVSKNKEAIRNVRPTNILLKNRLYNYCFKFYRKRIAYLDKTLLQQDFKLYYLVLLLKVLKEKGFVHIELNNKPINIDENNQVTVENLRFTSVDYSLVINDNPLGFEIEIINDLVGDKVTTKHLLLFDIDNSFISIDHSLKKELPNANNYTSVEVLSLWKTAFIEDINNSKNSFEIIINSENGLTEKQIIEKWLNSKISHSYASKELYEKYCPICRGIEKEFERNVYTCMNCKSVYTFYKDNDNKQNIWFIKLRRTK